MIIPEIDQRNNFFKGKLVGPVNASSMVSVPDNSSQAAVYAWCA